MDRFDVDNVSIRIRPATHQDNDTIALLWEKLVAYHRSLDAELPEAAPEGGKVYVERLIDREDDPNTQVFVADFDGQVIGYVLGVVVDLVPEMFMQEISGFLADIFVEEAFRGQGVGRALVEVLGDWFRAQGIRYFEWYVAAQNQAGRSFWDRMGGRNVMVRMRASLKQDEES